MINPTNGYLCADSIFLLQFQEKTRDFFSEKFWIEFFIKGNLEIFIGFLP
jgi:predicted ABC-type exoprotein transport system permease subunit